ncbi:MAG TPA: hypothetical protein VK338_03010, partial [Candidatus Nitrosocosmicus sp.]|nr:hypothetical protein [Candidatus Nitrosocosmicus sp.]
DSWIFDPHRAGGGVIMDTGINAISVVTAVLPQANLIVENARLEQHENIGVETAGNIDFTFGPETKGQMVLDWMHTGPEERTISFQTDHHDFWTIDINTGRLSCNGETRYETGNSLLEEYTAVYRDFIKHCKARTSSYSTKELAFVLDSYLYANYFSQSI